MQPFDCTVILTYVGEFCEALLKLLIRGDVILHLAAVEGIVSRHVKVASAGQTEEYGLFFAGLFALESLVDGRLDSVR